MTGIQRRRKIRRRSPRERAKRNSSILRFVRHLFLFSILMMVFSGYQSRRLPEPDTIRKELLRDPLQGATRRKPFVFEYYNKEYLVDPRAEYELYGLVVSHNNIHSIADMYHDKTSVDIKDLCVVWGSNVIDDIYQKVKFSSGAFTCHIETDTREIWENFDPSKLSNNHLLSDDESVRNIIRKASIGDQIYLKGMLVEYSSGGAFRGTSMTREDTGNGACEVVFVEEAKILKPANTFWRNLKKVSKTLSIFLGVFLVIFFFWATWMESR